MLRKVGQKSSHVYLSRPGGTNLHIKAGKKIVPSHILSPPASHTNSPLDKWLFKINNDTESKAHGP